MNDLDMKIKSAVKREVKKPLSFENAIKTAFINNNYKVKKNYPFLKVASIAACVIIGSTGIITASYIVHEKVWKEPTKINENEEIKKVTANITTEEKEEYITEESAIEISKKLLIDLGYGDREIREVNLQRGYDEEYSTHYILRSDDFLININPRTGEIEYFRDNSILYKDIKCDDVPQDEINKIAKDIYENTGIITENDGYKIVNTERKNIVTGQHINDLWQVSFAKDYNNCDKDNVSTICFAVCNGKVVISSIKGKRKENFANNDTVISKEEAINIAINKEKEFSNLEISKISAYSSIEKMNVFVYCLEKNTKNENGELKVNDIARNVWVVTIEHEKDNKPLIDNIETVKQLYNKSYYIDTTTGEIIGGKQAEN